MSTNEFGPGPQNPYAAPAADPFTVPVVDPDKDAERQRIRAFVGSNANYYLQKWRLPLEREGASAGFNWAAFFLTGLWLGYRKMYLAASLFAAFLLIETLGEELLFVAILGRDVVPDGMDLVVGLVCALVCGSGGNRWYLAHTRKAIDEVESRGLEEPAIKEVLSKRGGTSVLSAIGIIILFNALIIGLYFLLDRILF